MAVREASGVGSMQRFYWMVRVRWELTIVDRRPPLSGLRFPIRAARGPGEAGKDRLSDCPTVRRPMSDCPTSDVRLSDVRCPSIRTESGKREAGSAQPTEGCLHLCKFRVGVLAGELGVVQVPVRASERKQLVVGSAFDYLAVVHDEDQVGIPDRRESVRNDEARTM
jgi:hypothetical protein